MLTVEKLARMFAVGPHFGNPWIAKKRLSFGRVASTYYGDKPVGHSLEKGAGVVNGRPRPVVGFDGERYDLGAPFLVTLGVDQLAHAWVAGQIGLVRRHGRVLALAVFDPEAIAPDAGVTLSRTGMAYQYYNTTWEKFSRPMAAGLIIKPKTPEEVVKEVNELGWFKETPAASFPGSQFMTGVSSSSREHRGELKRATTFRTLNPYYRCQPDRNIWEIVKDDELLQEWSTGGVVYWRNGKKIAERKTVTDEAGRRYWSVVKPGGEELVLEDREQKVAVIKQLADELA